jgi:molybdopterin molybdotransferase
MLNFEDAKAQLLSDITPVLRTERISLENAYGRILAEQIDSPITQPAYPTSAMDGYAFQYDSAPDSHQYKRVGTSLAGHPHLENINPGECIRIMTGAILPPNTDTVIMQEQTTTKNDQVHFSKLPAQHSNVRPVGAELVQGQRVIDKHSRLGAPQIALIASLGIPRVRVYKPVSVAFFSTGDELQKMGRPLEPGQIYDSNRFAIRAMLASYGFQFHDLGVVKDDKQAIKDTLLHAASISDVIMTSGGVSVGDADYVKDLVESLGHLKMWKVAMKPGKPIAFGEVEDAYFFGLPGNPVSAMVTFYQLALPALMKMQGREFSPKSIQAKATAPFKKRAGRMEFQRAKFEIRDGEYTVAPLPSQSSAKLSSMHQANCFAILEKDTTEITNGGPIVIQPFEGFVE